jgi:hypothetical protein
LRYSLCFVDMSHIASCISQSLCSAQYPTHEFEVMLKVKEQLASHCSLL